jgi:PAS domain S-box-containing protein
MTNHRKKNSTFSEKNILRVVIVGFLLLTVTTLVAFGLYVIEKNRTVFYPLKTIVHQLQTEMDEIHRWVQRLFKRQSTTGIEFVWFQLDLSLSELRSILEGSGDAAIDIPDELVKALRTSLHRLDEDLATYKQTVAWILDSETTARATPPDGIDYERAYINVLSRIEGMERPIADFLDKGMLIFRNLMVGGIVSCLVLAVLITFTFRRFIRKQTADYDMLTSAYDQLRQELTERRQAEKSLQQSETLFRTVFETSPDAIVITRIADNQITDINDGFTTYTGYTRDEVVGRSVLEIQLWQDLGHRTALLNEVNSKGFAENWEAAFQTEHVGSLTCLLSTKKVNINGEAHILTVARDISDRKRFEARIQATNRFLAISNRHTEMQPLLREFIRETKKVSDCAAVAIRIVDADGRIPYVAADGFGEDFCSLNDPLFVQSSTGMCVRVINNRREPHAVYFSPYGSYRVNSSSDVLATASVDQRRLMRNTCHHYGYESIALIPIRSGERPLGLIHIADKRANQLTDNAVEILETAALQLGTAIERVQAEQALKNSHDQLEKRVAERTQMLSQAKDDLVLEVEKRQEYEQELLGFQQRLRILSSRLIQTEERERRRIAIDIHDRIGQTLAVTKMQLGAVQVAFADEDLEQHITAIRDLVGEAIRDVRTLTFELSPPILYELGLQAALEWFAENIRKQYGLRVDVLAEGSDRAIDADRRVIIFRTCRELLLNVVKHAAAKCARVHLYSDESLVTVTIADDGIGFDQTVLNQGFDPLERGFGLFSIKEQLQYYGGSLTIDSGPKRGSTLTIDVPMATDGVWKKEVLA